MIGPRTWYMYNSTDKKLCMVSYKNEFHLMPLGAGRLYSSSYLESKKWKIFDRNLQKLLDDKGYYGVLKDNLIVYNATLDDGCILSIKGNWDAMNPAENILKANPINASEILGNDKNKILKKYKKSFDLL